LTLVTSSTITTTTTGKNKWIDNCWHLQFLVLKSVCHIIFLLLLHSNYFDIFKCFNNNNDWWVCLIRHYFQSVNYIYSKDLLMTTLVLLIRFFK
jgi:hypothetical protein